MTKEEQIALELTRIELSHLPDNVCITDGGSIITYNKILKKLQGDKEDNTDIVKLQDEIGTYKYIINGIKQLINRDGSNFVLKEDLEEILGGIYE